MEGRARCWKEPLSVVDALGTSTVLYRHSNPMHGHFRPLTPTGILTLSSDPHNPLMPSD